MQFDPRNILVIDFGQLGDVVLSLPALRGLRERFPNARITVAVGKPGAEVISLSGYSDATLEVDRVALRDGPKLVSAARILKFVSQVRKIYWASSPARHTGSIRAGLVVHWTISQTSNPNRLRKMLADIWSIATWMS